MDYRMSIEELETENFDNYVFVDSFADIASIKCLTCCGKDTWKDENGTIYVVDSYPVF